MTVEEVIEQYIKNNPHSTIAKLDYNAQSIWIKRRPVSKKNIWHTLVKYLSFLTRLPIIYPTVVADVSDSLLKEAKQLSLLAENNIPVPDVLLIKKEYLVTSDVGLTLQNHLDSCDLETKNLLLEKAVMALGRVHQAKLCHGRPSLRDMTYKEEQVFFIDLEEDPLRVMNLAQAQARDLWLLFLAIAGRCRNEPEVLIDLFQCYLSYANNETLAALQQMVFYLRPLRRFAEYGLFFIKSRDLRNAVLANKMIELSFKNS